MKAPYKCIQTVLLPIALVFGSTGRVQAQHKPIALPPQAAEVAHGIYDLGVARDADGTLVQGFAFIHYKQDFIKPDRPGGPKPPKGSSCYAFLAAGAKWKVLEPFIFDAEATDALARLNDIKNAITTWEVAAGNNILGPGVTSKVFRDALGTLNGYNEVMFGDIQEPGVIAMTIVWGQFGGPPAGRQLVEWDMVFGNGWGWWFDQAIPTRTAMDFMNIATHEIGHAVGMDHPSDTCTEETMYAYADWRETKKRDLNAGDITGIRKLYP